jgi:hypothetical protein
MFQRAYGLTPGRWQDIWRGLVWLAGFAVWIVLSAPLRNELDDVGGVGVAVSLRLWALS